jgi:phosphoglycolate phosphatase-like HAD superfamily hydrolase
MAEAHLLTKVELSNVWVIGDTPLDVECARSIGARAVLVSTGWHTQDELVASNPDYLLPDLTHAGPLLAEWGW